MGKTRKPDPFAVCCVVTCANHEFISQNERFYRFPLEQTQRDKWIAAVREINGVGEDGKPWKPNNNSIICCNHFFRTYKSKNPRKKNYVPTLFLDVAKRESTKASTTEVQTISSRKRKKTNAQICREYRERQKLLNTMIQNMTAEGSDECRETDQLAAKKPKTNAERRKKYYEAQKLKKQKSKKIPKTAKQRSKECYDRKKKFQALNTLNHHSDAKSTLTNAETLASPHASGSGSGKQNSPPNSKTASTRNTKPPSPLPNATTLASPNAPGSRPKNISAQTRDANRSSDPPSMNEKDSMSYFGSNQIVNVKPPFICPIATNPLGSDQPVENLREMQSKFIDHIVMAYLNRCRSRAGLRNIGMPNYILKAKAQEAAILLSTYLEEQYGWLDRFKIKMDQNDAMGIVLTSNPQSLDIADILEDEWPKFSKENGLDMDADSDSEETVSVIDYEVEEEEEEEIEEVSLNAEEDTPIENNDAGDDMHDIHSSSPCLSNIEPSSKETAVIEKNKNYTSQPEFLRHVLSVFVKRFKAKWPNAVEIPSTIFSSIFNEAALYLDSDIKNKNLFFGHFKHNFMNKKSFKSIDSEAESYRNLSLKITDIIEEEWPKGNNCDKGSPAEDSELEEVTIEVTIADEATNVDEERIAMLINDDDDHDDDDDGPDGIQTYEEARDCLNLLQNYALGSSDSIAVALLSQMDTFLRSEDCKD